MTWAGVGSILRRCGYFLGLSGHGICPGSGCHPMPHGLRTARPGPGVGGEGTALPYCCLVTTCGKEAGRALLSQRSETFYFCITCPPRKADSGGQPDM